MSFCGIGKHPTGSRAILTIFNHGYYLQELILARKLTHAFLADLESVPDAVELTNINSSINTIPESTNANAIAVANKESISVEVISDHEG